MRKKIIITAMFLLFLLFCIVTGVSIEKNIGVVIGSELGNQCTFIINNAVEHALSENIDIADIPMVEKTEQGLISYVSVNNMKLNRFSMDVMSILEDEI